MASGEGEGGEGGGGEGGGEGCEGEGGGGKGGGGGGEGDGGGGVGGSGGEGHTSIWRATPANENQRPLAKAWYLVFFTESVTCAQRREGGFDLARGGLGAPGAAHGQRVGRWCGL